MSDSGSDHDSKRGSRRSGKDRTYKSRRERLHRRSCGRGNARDRGSSSESSSSSSHDSAQEKRRHREQQRRDQGDGTSVGRDRRDRRDRNGRRERHRDRDRNREDTDRDRERNRGSRIENDRNDRKSIRRSGSETEHRDRSSRHRDNWSSQRERERERERRRDRDRDRDRERARERARHRQRDGDRDDRKHRRDRDYSDDSERGGNHGQRSSNRDRRDGRDRDRDRDRDSGRSVGEDSSDYRGRSRHATKCDHDKSERANDTRDKEESGKASTENAENDSKSLNVDCITTVTSRRRRRRDRRDADNDQKYDYSMNDYPEYVQHQLDPRDERGHPYEHEMRQDRYGRSIDPHEQQQSQHGSIASRYGGQTQDTGLSGGSGGSGNRTMEAEAHTLQRVSSQLPTRPKNAMKNGRGVYPVEICANSCKIELMVETITKYDVEFDPQIPEDARMRRDQIFKQIGKHLRNIYSEYFTDNTRVFATKHVEEDKQFPFDGGKGTVTLKNGSSLQVHELETQYKLQIIGIVAQKLYRKAKLRRLGTKLYDFQNCTRIRFRDEQKDDPTHLALCPGFRHSTDMTVEGIQLGFDTCHRLLEDRTVADVLDNIWNETIERFGQLSQHEQFDMYAGEAIRQLQRRTGLSDFDCKLYRIDDIDFNLSKDSLASEQHPNGLTIADYYAMHYDIHLESDRNGMIIHKKKLRGNEQSQTVMKIPPELLRLTGYDAKLHAKKRNVTTDISNATKVPAIKRYNAWKKIMDKLYQITQTDKEMKEIVTIESSKMNGEGRGTIGAQILECPKIVLRQSKESSSSIYHGGINDSMSTTGGDARAHNAHVHNANNANNANIGPVDTQSMFNGSNDSRKGSDKYWITGPENLQYHWKSCSFVERGDKLGDKWGIVYHEENNSSQANELIESMMDYAKEGGFKHAINDPKRFPLQLSNVDPKFWDREFARHICEKLCHYKQLKALVVVLPREKDRVVNKIYSAVKHSCSVDKAILSQCVKAQHSAKKHVILGVLRQILVKLGSIPWKIKFDLANKRLDIINTPTMVVGINVNHDTRKSMSVVGFAASYDRDFVRYWTNIKHQKQGKELIDDLDQPMAEAIDNFQRINNGVYPRQIIVYRDGVSSTMVEQVWETELLALKRGIQQECKDPENVRLQFITVQKRVNNRFVLTKNKQSVPPGTAINTCVVSNQMWDFFIVPAKPPPNCLAIPTRFCVLCDELKLGEIEDGSGEHDLMTFTNGLCSLYFNWPGPTRVPAPIKYAAKIAQQYCQALSGEHPHCRLDLTYHFL